MSRVASMRQTAILIICFWSCLFNEVDIYFDYLFLILSLQWGRYLFWLSRYKKVHTGPNNQSGGWNRGFLRFLYHWLFTLGTVRSPASPPTAWGITIETTNLVQSILKAHIVSLQDEEFFLDLRPHLALLSLSLSF